MPQFAYKAINESGSTVSGIIEADTADAAMMLLNAQGYIPSKVIEKGATSSFGLWSRLKTKTAKVKIEEIVIFTKQFRTMLVVGMPLVRLLEVLENQTHNMKLKDAVSKMVVDIKEGSALHEAFEKHRKIFSDLYVNMVKAGEMAGNLPEVFDRLIYIQEHEHKLKSDIRAALQYPMLVMITLVLAFIFLITFVIPKFAAIFATAGIALPLPTRICIFIYEFLANFWYLIIAVIAGSIVVAGYYLSTGQGRFLKDKIVLNLPILGSVFTKAAMSRFASIFSILQASGIPILSGLKILVGTIGNDVIARELKKISGKVEEGRGITNPLRSSKNFPPMVVDMIAIGEETGKLDDMLREISTHYDDEVEYAVKRMSDTVGPVLIVALAVLVGFFALAIFLPMWDLTKMATQQ